MRVVVTGAGPNGFLGNHVKKAFEKHDAIFVGSKDYDLMCVDDVMFMLIDHTPNVIVHMAAACGGILANKNSPADFLAKNTLMNINLFNAVKCIRESNPDVGEYVYTLGSVCAYPKYCPIPFKEDDLFNGYPEETNAPYGVAKRHLYMMGKTCREQYGIKGAHLIPVNLYGPHDHFGLTNSHVIPALINKFTFAVKMSLPFVECWGTGEATREFLYAGDCAEAIVKAVDQQLDTPLPINIGTGKDISIKDLAYLVAELTSFNGQIKFTGDVSDGQPRRRLDVSRAKEMLGFEATTELREGLVKTIAWYQNTLEKKW